MSSSNVILLYLLLVCYPIIDGGRKLNDYIGDYEILDYNPSDVHYRHLRVRRWTAHSGTTESPILDLKFKTQTHNFHLRLKRETNVFSEDVEMFGDDGNPSLLDLDTSHLYSGHLEGVPGSNVFGSIRDGVFDGQIVTPHETFFIERAHKYSLDLPSTNSSLHSVIYSGNDVKDPYEHYRTGHAKGCGITDEVMAWMESIQNSGLDDDDPSNSLSLRHPKSKPFQREGPTPEALKSTLDNNNNNNIKDGIFYHNKYSRESNQIHEDPNGTSYVSSKGASIPYLIKSSNRGRRALPTPPNSRTTCTLSIQTDPLLWKHIAEQEKTNDETKIREEILSLIAQHVKAVNHIYSNTLFDGNQSYKNIRFEVQRIKIDTDKPCRPDYKGEKNLFCIENIDVSNFLNLHSLTDHHVFCLAYVFTYRDFTGGTLGLAWVASAAGASGGVCETYKTYTETIGGVYQSTRRSLNTGIITFVNYNSRVPPKVSQLTLAHEIGHNFGSPHDYPNKCRPGGSDGNYIMFASATSGDRPNNSKFSDCSVKNISSVLDAILYYQKKTNCFISTNGTFCGNKIVEEGEECDCGYNYEECMEDCCYPRQINQSDLLKNPSAHGCKRKPVAKCSPSEGPCCDARSCNFVSTRNAQLCKHETECSLNSSCNGTTAQCPIPISKSDIQTTCNDGTQVCQGGECRGSICLKFGLRECFLSSSDKSVDKRKLCDLACLDRNGRCKSTAELNLPGLTRGLSLRPGAPCDNFQGYCDVFLKCRAVDAEGPLARLKNLLFNKETLLNIAQWVTEYWWAVLLVGVAFIIVMGLFIKCCAVHTPSSNPKKAPARRIGDTLRRPINTLRRHRNTNYRAASTGVNMASNGAPPGSHHHPNHPVSPPPYSSGPVPPGGTAGPPVPRPHGFGENRGPNRGRNNLSRPSPGGGRSSSGSGGGGYQVPNKKNQAQHRV